SCDQIPALGVGRHHVFELPPEQAAIERDRFRGIWLTGVNPARDACDVPVSIRHWNSSRRLRFCHRRRYLGQKPSSIRALQFSRAPCTQEEIVTEFDKPGGRGRVVQVTDRSYMPGRPVRVRVRHRAPRYEIDDMGAAVAIAGRPPGWRQAAERAATV